MSLYKSMSTEQLNPRNILEEFDETVCQLEPGIELGLNGTFEAGAVLVHDVLKDWERSFLAYEGERDKIEQRLRHIGHALTPPFDPARSLTRRIKLFEGEKHSSDMQKPVLWAELVRQPGYPDNAPMYERLQITLRRGPERVLGLYNGAPRISPSRPEGINIQRPIERAEYPMLFDALRVVQSISAVLPR